MKRPKIKAEVTANGGARVLRTWLEESRTAGPRAKWRKVKGDRPRLRFVRFCCAIER